MSPVPGIAHDVAAELIGAGARAVVLVGSQVTHRDHECSDVDLIAVGSGPARQLEWRDGWLLSVTWRTAEVSLGSFADPSQAGVAVPAWRRGEILLDPDAVALELRNAALRWTWGSIAAACDRWVAEQVVDNAEEALRLAGSIGQGREDLTAVLCAWLGIRLTMTLAVHLRLLLDSENDVWSAVADGLGPEWAALRDHALGAGAPPGDRGLATLRLYETSVDVVRDVLDQRERAVTAGVIARARSTLADYVPA